MQSTLSSRWRLLETPEEFRRRIGQVEIGRSYHFETRGGVIRDFVLSVSFVGVVVGVTLWLIWPWLLPLLIGIPAFTVYCAIAYFVRVRPNHDHLRQPFGSFRVSDDVNHYMILFDHFFSRPLRLGWHRRRCEAASPRSAPPRASDARPEIEAKTAGGQRPATGFGLSLA